MFQQCRGCRARLLQASNIRLIHVIFQQQAATDVSTPGLYLGHSMSTTLWKSPEIEDTQKNVIKNICFKIYKKDIFQKIKIFISVFLKNLVEKLL
jgi:hypothetical protein